MTSQEIELIRQNAQLIKDNLSIKASTLALQWSKLPHRKLLISQVAALQKAQKKLPLWAQTNGIIWPSGLAVEQCSSQATAQLKASLVDGKQLIDITGGFGVDAYYLSKSFKKTTYIEQNSDLAQIAALNFEALNSGITVRNGDGRNLLKESDADFVMVDPYRRDDGKNKVFALADCLPNVTKMLDDLVNDERSCLIKTSPMLDISLAVSQLKFVREIWVVSVKNECKEVNYLLHKKHDNTVIKCFNIQPDKTDLYEYDFNKINTQKPTISKTEKYLYEPNTSILKAGLQDELAISFGLDKLNPNSHLYTNQQWEANFPGKQFEILSEHSPNDKSLKGSRYNIIARNYGLKANEIEKKLRIKPAEKEYLIASKNHLGKPTLFKAILLNE